MRYLLTCCLILASLSFLSAQGWIKKYPEDTSKVQHLIKISDGNYVMVLNQEVFLNRISLLKLDSKGQVSKRVILPLAKPVISVGLPTFRSTTKLMNCPDGDVLVVVQTTTGSILYKIGIDLNVKWTKDWIYSEPITKVKGNEVIFVGTVFGQTKSIMITLGLDGTVKSELTLNSPTVKDFQIVDDGFLVLNQQVALHKLDLTGTIVRTKILTPYDIHSSHSFIKTDDGNYVIAIDSTKFFYKVDKNANTIWEKVNVYNTPFIAPNTAGGFIAISQPFNRFNPRVNGNPIFQKYDSKGDSIVSRTLVDEVANKLIKGVASVGSGNFIYYGESIGTREYWGGNQAFSAKVDSLGNPYPKAIAGFIKLDEDKNCTNTPAEKAISNIVVHATSSTGEIYRGITDKNGFFNIGLFNGSYTVAPIVTSLSRYLSLCTPSVSASVVDGKNPDTVQLSVKPLISAPLMQVDITTPFLRRCFNNTYYVQYCNKGTTQAKDAFVDITLDSLIEYQSATLPLKSKIGNIYRFNLGNVEINDCNSFEITARVRCGDSTRLGQTLCVKAKIYPDTTGAPTTNWSGANITIKGGCVGDSAVFIIKNEGTAATKPLKAKTYQNEDVFESFNLQLPAQGIMTKKYKSNNKTWRITSEQEPNHPNSTRPTKFVEPCSNEPILTLQSPALAFSSDDFALSVDEDCQQIRGAYDPNDKTGYPLGKKGVGQIPENQDIEYIIRFQNTGTDTAFTVVVKDTLPTVLDASSIQWGASSHPYTPSFEGKNVAVFTFNNILLVDSFTNEPKSNGFVRIRIKQNLNLVKGTKIQNSAGIYFDFNPPIITNKTLHTIGVDEFTSPVNETFSQDLMNVKVSPNPFTDKTHFKLEKPLFNVGQIEVFDLNGRSLQTEFIKNQEFDFNKKNLKSGIYIFKISENGLIIGQGKIAVQ